MLTRNEQKIVTALTPSSEYDELPLARNSEIANKLDMVPHVIMSCLWNLLEKDIVKRTEGGLWGLAVRPPGFTVEQRRLLEAVRASRRDVKMTDLAARASVPRSELRSRLDELVKLGGLAERLDGWYKVLR